VTECACSRGSFQAVHSAVCATHGATHESVSATIMLCKTGQGKLVHESQSITNLILMLIAKCHARLASSQTTRLRRARR